MYCAFCGEEFNGRPIRQDNRNYCSLGCADAAAGVSDDEEDDDYFEETLFDMDVTDDELAI